MDANDAVPLELPEVKKAEKIIQREGVYKMTSRPRGICLIINNEIHEDPKMNRKGSKMDEQRFKHVFEELGFNISVKKNLTTMEMISALDNYAKNKCHWRHDAGVVIVLAHGGKGEVYGVEANPEKLKTKTICDMLNNKKCKGLANKPKMIFIQACQGDEPDVGVLYATDVALKKLPTTSDIILSVSAQTGYTTLRDESKGGLYAERLANVLAENAWEKNLSEMLEMVEREVRNSTMESVLSTKYKTIGWSQSLYFNPGLFENKITRYFSSGNNRDKDYVSLETEEDDEWNNSDEDLQLGSNDSENTKAEMAKSLLELYFVPRAPEDPIEAEIVLKKAYEVGNQPLLIECSKILEKNISLENCIDMLKLSKMTKCITLRRRARRFILWNFQQLIETGNIYKLQVSQMTNLMTSDKLFVSREEELFKAVEQWVKANHNNRKKHLEVLVNEIRLPLCETRILQEIVGQSFFSSLNSLNSFMKPDKFHSPNLKEKIGICNRHGRQALYIFGGWKSNEEEATSVEKYDYVSCQWMSQENSDSQEPRGFHVSVPLGNSIFVIENKNGQVKMFDPMAGTWHQRSKLKIPRMFVCAAVVDSQVYAAGGYLTGNSTKYTNICERYDPETDTWTRVADMKYARCFASATSLRGKVYCGGGWNSRYLSSFEVYEPRANIWTEIQSLRSPMCGLGLAACDNYVWVFGGWDGDEESNKVKQYNPKTDSWTRMPALPTSRSCMTVAFFGGDFYAIGGRVSDDKNVGVTEIYRPKKGVWEKAPNLIVDRYSLSSCVLNV